MASDTDPWENCEVAEKETSPWWSPSDSAPRKKPRLISRGESTEAAEPDPWAQASAPLKSHQLHLETGAQIAQSTSQRGEKPLNAFELNGQNAARVQNILRSSCRKGCTRPGCRPNAIPQNETMAFLRTYWSLTGEERSHLLRCLYYGGLQDCGADSAVTKSDQINMKTAWHIMGTQVCFSRFCTVIGSSQRTIRKSIAGLQELHNSHS